MKPKGLLHIMDWIKILPQVENANIQQLAKKHDVTYAHLHKLIHIFEVHGWLTIERVGRENKMRLTRRGYSLAKLCKKIVKEA